MPKSGGELLSSYNTRTDDDCIPDWSGKRERSWWHLQSVMHEVCVYVCALAFIHSPHCRHQL